MSRSVNYVGSGDASLDSTTLPSLSMDQCTQLISFLQQHMNIGGHSSLQQPVQFAPSPSSSTQSPSDPNLHFSGMFSLSSSFSSSNVLSSSTSWLIDTGATHHVCCRLVACLIS